MEHYSNVVKAMIARSNARAADIADKIQARAYYQFQYVPPAGPLPGWSMEQQTEDAINEIGNIAYSSDEIAREAREIAQQAYNAAQAAIEMATNAITAAQNAQQTADTALNTANTAVTKADNAQASADAAQKAADAAQKSANDAQTSADNAQSTANTAIENASQALSAANEAKASADQSNQRLDVLEPIVDTLRWYENVTDNIDFNTRVELERAFLQGTANTNGPVAGPGWLDVDDDYNETYIRHKFIAQADGACYVRFGTIVPDSSPIEVSSWTGWVKYALASELTSAVETINTSITSINGEITTIKSDITSIESDITELQGSLGSAEGDITAVTNALDAHKADYDNPHKVTAAQLGLATVYKYKGSVETYANLPTSGQQVGDVYNVKQADPDHNIEAGDNVAWDGEKWDILAGDTDLSGYAQLNSANTFTALNAFRANIAVSNGTAAGSQGQVIFGVKPSTATVQANIIASTTGALNYIATESTGHYFKIGNNTASTSITTNESETAILSHNTFEFARITNAGVAKWLGNANTATKLETARTINGVPFDGTQNITIEAGQGTFLPLTGGTVTGPIYLPSTTPTTDTQAVTKKYVDDSVAGAGGGDVTAVTNALDAHKADYDNPHKVTAAQLGLATVYKYKGSVETYANLPTSGQQVGDVYNVKQADPDHNIEAGDNVAWDGEKWDILAGDTDLSGYAQLNSANTFTALNAFRANIAVSNGTAAGSQGQVIFGVKPSTATVQANIIASTTGALNYIATESTGHYFKIGNNTASTSITTNESETAILSHNTFEFARITNAGVAKWLGNANTATKLETARTINGVPFDGTQNITIEAGQGTFLPLTGGTVTGPIYLPSTTPTTDTQAVTKKYVDDSVAGAGGGDVTAAGNNAFTGLNTFANETTFGNELNVWDSLTSQSSTGQINIGRVSGANGAYITGESGGGLALHTKKGQPLELLDGVDGNLAVLTTSQATIYPNIVQIGSATLLESVGIRKATIGDYPLQILDGNMIAAQFNGNSHKAAFEASEVMINSSEISTNFAIKNASQNILDCNGTAMHLRTGNSSIGLELGSGTSGWALQCPADATDVRVARRLYVGSQGGVGNGVISADNTENCLYFCGTAENTYYSTPNTGNTISYQAAANVYLINTSINDAASLTMNFSNMSFHATVGSTPYMCKTLTFWFATGATAPTVTWQFPSGAAVYYPKGVAPSLTANASNIINVVAIVDDTDSFSIQVCDVVALPYSG